MSKVRKIALIISASNFERQKRIVHAVHEELQKMGDYALYVFTSYGIYIVGAPYDMGGMTICELVKGYRFDGCIIENNIALTELINDLVKECYRMNIPTVTVNVSVEGTMFVDLDAYYAQKKIMEHLIEEHHCTKINFIGFAEEDVFSQKAIKAYKEVLEHYAIPYESRRILYKKVSIDNGRSLIDLFKEEGIDDAQATICLHDVLAIGYCLELEKRGFSIPQDMRICSLNYSSNSMAFEPVITGVDRQDELMARKACQLLNDRIHGCKIERENYIKGRIYFGQSCGCNHEMDQQEKRLSQDIIVNKIETGSQIALMMKYNDSLEKADSLQKLGDCVYSVLQGQKGNEFIFCLNQSAISYILNKTNEYKPNQNQTFDDTMIAIAGNVGNNGRMEETAFKREELLPIDAKAGDIYIFMPIHRNERVYGYVVYVNNYAPIDIYNHRILHESIGSGIGNLRRQMKLRSSLQELETLHMHDALTGLYNCYAQERYGKQYMNSGSYCIVMIDMDSMKEINDIYGHLAGNNSLSVMAEALRTCTVKDDLLIRYGGDEFLILSYIVDSDYWNGFDEKLNQTIECYATEQKLPYRVRASVGYCICNKDDAEAFEECYKIADRNMYRNKKERKRNGEL